MASKGKLVSMYIRSYNHFYFHNSFSICPYLMFVPLTTLSITQYSWKMAEGGGWKRGWLTLIAAIMISVLPLSTPYPPLIKAILLPFMLSMFLDNLILQNQLQ